MNDKALHNKIDQLTEAITKMVNHPVLPVAPVLPIAPIAPIAPIVQTNSGDHDLLTKLDTKVDNIQMDVTALKNQNSQYITKIEFSEVVRIQADHETRTRLLEKTTTQIMTWGTALMIFIGIVEFLVQKFVK